MRGNKAFYGALPNSLVLVRFLFTCLMGYYYLFEWSDGWKSWFVGVSLCFFFIFHLLYHNWLDSQKRYFSLVLKLDFALTLAYALVFPSSEYPNQVLLAFVSLFLFIVSGSRSLFTKYLSFLGVYWICLILLDGWQGYQPNYLNISINGGLVVFSSLLGWLLHDNQRKSFEMAELYQRLQQYSLQIEELAENRERVRIAREIHDTVGHKMTALLAQQQAARRLYSINPDKSFSIYVKCEDLARSALQEIRLSVQAIRGGEKQHSSIVQSLDKLLTEFSEATKIHTSLIIPKSIQVPTTISLVFYRIVQESLTNAHKHGQASQIKVTLREKDTEYQLQVVDNGKGTNQLSFGFGLLNMKERVREHHGEIHITTKVNQGFQVFISIPKEFSTEGEKLV